MLGFRYPAVVLLLGAVVGTLLGHKLNPGLPIIVAVFVAATCFLIYGFLRLPGKYFVLPLMLLTISASFLNSNKMYHSFPANHIRGYADSGEKLRYFGRIVKWPLLKRHKTLIACEVDSVSNGRQIVNASGIILITIARETTHFSLGDRICFSGVLRKPFISGYPGQFDYARYLGGKGIHGVMNLNAAGAIMVLKEHKNWMAREINNLRLAILKCFRENLTELPAALASGFLIGETRDIPDDIYLAFRRTGTMHLLAVSGSNVALVLMVVAFLLRFVKLHRVIRLAVFLSVIVVFAHLSYNQPSVIRASLMAAMLLIAGVCYRRAELHNIIAAAATILIFYDPANLFDIGFQLSFAVTWGLILLLPEIHRLTVDRQLNRFWRYLLLIVSSSLIASLISAPITAYYFGEVSLVTVFSNLIVVPLVSAAVVGIALLLLVNLALPAAAIIPGMFLDRLLGLIQLVVHWFGQWEYSSMTITSFPAAYSYGVLAGVVLFLPAIKFRILRTSLILMIGLIGMIALVKVSFQTPDDFPSVEIYNLHQTQTIIINRGEGVVLFRQDDYSRREPFSDDLLPYLERRNGPLPRYYIFTESRYLTENRMTSAGDKGYNLNFRPVQIDPAGWAPSIYEICRGEPKDMPLADHQFYAEDGLVEIVFPDSGRVLYAASIDHLKSYPAQKIRQVQTCYIAIENKAELEQFRSLPDPGKAVLLLRQPVEQYQDIDELLLSAPDSPRIVSLEEGAVFIRSENAGR